MKNLLHKAKTILGRLLLFLTLFFSWSMVRAQSLSVESFRLLENDLTANTYGSVEYDQNGEVAALIKIITTETGFAFDGGILGIVKTLQKVSEVWVYVPRGLQRIKIMHPQLGQTEYYFPVSIQSARTYEMRLISGRVRTVVQDEVAAQFVTFTVTPQNAVVTIDGNQYSLQADGTVSQLLSYGTHTYRVDAPGYFPENGVVEMGRERVSKQVNLKSSRGTITLECAMKEAELYVNGNHVGTGSWTGELDAAMYQVEVKRDGYTTRTTSFSIEPQEVKTVSLPLPLPIYASISVTSQPIGTTVFIDGEEIGTTPLIKGEILTGHRKLEFRKKDYRTLVMDVEIKEGEINSFNAELIDEFTLTLNTEPAGATISINGENKGNTPYSTLMRSGDYVLHISKSGYIPYKKKIHLGGDDPNLFFKLQRKILYKTNFYAGANYQVTHISGIEAFGGMFLYGLNLEAAYLLPSAKEYKVYWLDNPESWTGNSNDYYTYSLNNAYSVYVGYGILVGDRFRFTPRVGALFNQIEGKYNNPSEGLDEHTYVVTGRGGLRVEYSPLPHIGIVCTPAFDVPVMKGSLASKLDATSNMIKEWCSGFSLNVGLELYF